MPDLKFLASTVPEIWRGSQNFKNRSRDPGHAPFLPSSKSLYSLISLIVWSSLVTIALSVVKNLILTKLVPCCYKLGVPLHVITEHRVHTYCHRNYYHDASDDSGYVSAGAQRT